MYDDIPCWNGIVRLLLGLIFLGDIVTSALLINEFHWMGFKYE